MTDRSNAWMDSHAQGQPAQVSTAASKRLRIFSDESSSSPPWPSSSAPSPLMTLTQFFEHSYVHQCLPFARPKHLKELRKSLAYWARFTLDPPLAEIGPASAQAFTAGLSTLQGKLRGSRVAPNTIRKHVIHVQSVLDGAGPAARRRAWRANLIATTPFIARPATTIDRRIKRSTVAEISALLSSYGKTVYSPRGLRGVSAQTWWECITLVGYNVGLSIGALIALRWQWIEQDDIGHWIRLPADVDGVKRSRTGRDYCVNRFALDALDRMRVHGGDLVFPWDRAENTLYRTLKRAHAAAGIPYSRRYGFHALRRACNTELTRINAAAAKMQMGHASGADSRGGDVTIDYYTALEILAESIELLPQPTRLDGQQRLLF